MAVALEKLPPELREQRLKEVEAVVLRHREKPGALLGILKEVQDILGYLPEAALQKVAHGLDLPLSQVYGTSTFYTLFHTRPRGKHIIRFCESAPCHVQGAREVLEAIERELGIAAGEDTPDGNWSVELVSCIGVCGVAPAIMIDDRVYGNLTPAAIPAILASYR